MTEKSGGNSKVILKGEVLFRNFLTAILPGLSCKTCEKTRNLWKKRETCEKKREMWETGEKHLFFTDFHLFVCAQLRYKEPS